MIIEVRPLGAIIRYLRKIRKISQKSLADGVCSIRHLQSIEKGKANPTPFVFERLLIKLGETPSKYLFNFANVCDQRTFVEIQEIQTHICTFKYYDAYKKFQAFLRSGYPDHDFTRQFVLWCESVFLRELDGYYTAALEKAIQAIRITIDDFSIDSINCHVLTIEEYFILNELSLIYYALGDFENSINILVNLKSSFCRTYISDTLKAEVLPIVCYNMSRYYRYRKMNMEGLEVCNFGIDISRKYNNFEFLGQLLYIRAGIYGLIGELEKSNADFYNAINCFALLNDNEMVDKIKRNAIEKHDISLK